MKQKSFLLLPFLAALAFGAGNVVPPSPVTDNGSAHEFTNNQAVSANHSLTIENGGYLDFASGATLSHASTLLTALGAQPLDADLNSIAALTTTAPGRSLLTLSPSSADMFYWNGSAWTAIPSTTATGRGLLNASAATAAGLGLTNGATIDSWGGKTAPSGTVLGTSDSQTLTNKTISGASNTLNNLAAATHTFAATSKLLGRVTAGSGAGEEVGMGTGLSMSGGNLNLASTAGGLGLTNGSTIDSWGGKTVPSGTVVGTSDSQTFTNKTISGASNTLNNLGAASTTLSATQRFIGRNTAGSGAGEEVTPAQAAAWLAASTVQAVGGTSSTTLETPAARSAAALNTTFVYDLWQNRSAGNTLSGSGAISTIDFTATTTTFGSIISFGTGSSANSGALYVSDVLPWYAQNQSQNNAGMDKPTGFSLAFEFGQFSTISPTTTFTAVVGQTTSFSGLQSQSYGFALISSTTTSAGLYLMYNNGGGSVSVSSGQSVTTANINRVAVTSDGAGNLVLYLNTASVAATALGPTGNSSTAVPKFSMSIQNGTTASNSIMAIWRNSYFKTD